MINTAELDIIDDVLAVEQTEAWKIKDDCTADWTLKKIANEKKELDRLTDTIDQQIEQLEARKTSLVGQFEISTGFLKGKLHEYFETVEKKETTTQLSYKLPSGSLVFRKSSIKYERNDEQIIEYLAKNKGQEFLTHKIGVNWADLKKSELDLEKIDGVTKVETVPEFTIKI